MMAWATLVSGPIGHSVIRPGCARKVAMITSTACPSASATVGSGRSTPSRPVRPWTWSAVTGSRCSGRAQPAWTGMS